jgi:hypothetical protein
MNNTLLLTFATLLSAVFALPAHAAGKTTVLKPTSKWVVDYEDDFCRLSRNFGEGEDKLTLIMDRYSPSQSFLITLVGKPINHLLYNGSVKLRFGPDEAEQDVETFPGKLGEATPSLIMRRSIAMAPSTKDEIKRFQAAMKSGERTDNIFTDMSDARIQTVKHLSIYKSKYYQLQLETGSMGKPMAAMSQCIDQLVASWGVDVKRHANLSKKVTPLKSSTPWVTHHDFPGVMIQKQQPAIVNFRLSVDEKGVASACHIQKTHREKGFDDVVCKSMMKNARFLPALDANKVPIASYYLGSVTFQF